MYRILRYVWSVVSLSNRPYLFQEMKKQLIAAGNYAQDTFPQPTLYSSDIATSLCKNLQTSSQPSHDDSVMPTLTHSTNAYLSAGSSYSISVHEFSPKPHQCPLCPYSARKRQHLRYHMRTHTGEKPHCCTKCQYRAATVSNLNRHIANHHSQEQPLIGHELP